MPMEIVIHAKAWARVSQSLHRIEERASDQLGVVHLSSAKPFPAEMICAAAST
jgi:hypothetical protein